MVLAIETVKRWADMLSLADVASELQVIKLDPALTTIPWSAVRDAILAVAPDADVPSADTNVELQGISEMGEPLLRIAVVVRKTSPPRTEDAATTPSSDVAPPPLSAGDATATPSDAAPPSPPAEDAAATPPSDVSPPSFPAEDDCDGGGDGGSDDDDDDDDDDDGAAKTWLIVSISATSGAVVRVMKAERVPEVLTPWEAWGATPVPLGDVSTRFDGTAMRDYSFFMANAKGIFKSNFDTWADDVEWSDITPSPSAEKGAPPPSPRRYVMLPTSYGQLAVYGIDPVAKMLLQYTFGGRGTGLWVAPDGALVLTSGRIRGRRINQAVTKTAVLYEDAASADETQMARDGDADAVVAMDDGSTRFTLATLIARVDACLKSAVEYEESGKILDGVVDADMAGATPSEAPSETEGGGEGGGDDHEEVITVSVLDGKGNVVTLPLYAAPAGDDAAAGAGAATASDVEVDGGVFLDGNVASLVDGATAEATSPAARAVETVA